MNLTLTNGAPGLYLSTSLQIVTLIVAAVGPVLAYRYARRLSVTAIHQAWLDSLRQDLAELIAQADEVAGLWNYWSQLTNQKEKRDYWRVVHDKGAELQALRYRVKLRLQSGNSEHERLKAAVDVFVESHTLPPVERGPLRAEMMNIAESIIAHMWKRIELD
jgi:hypothetical protein